MADDVKILRRALGMNQREFAEALAAVKLREIGGRIGDVRAITPTRIADYEGGRRVPDKLMQKAMEVLGADHGKRA